MGKAIEEAIVDDNKPSAGRDEASVAAAASDVFSVASSVFTGVTEVLKAVEDARKDSDKDASFKSTDEVKVEDVGSDDEWSIVTDKKAHGTLKIEEEKDLSISNTEPHVLFAKWNEELRKLR